MIDRTWTQSGEHVEDSDGEYSFSVGSVKQAASLASILNGLQGQVKKLRDIALSSVDTLERIGTEYPSVVTPCKCGPGGACSKCEITHLLMLWRQEMRLDDEPLTVEEEHVIATGGVVTRLNAIQRACVGL